MDLDSTSSAISIHVVTGLPPKPSVLKHKETSETCSSHSLIAGDMTEIPDASEHNKEESNGPNTTIATGLVHEDDSNLTDEERMAKADQVMGEEQLLGAARLLRRVTDTSLLTPEHQRILLLAHDVEEAIADLVGNVREEDGWKRQAEMHGKHDTLIYYKIDDDARLTCRMETPIEQSLLIPLLSVLNESELYPDWIPSYRMPRMGIEKTVQLEKSGRANQILQVVCPVPWPFSTREVVLQATALDDIDAQGYIAVRLHALEPGGVVPPPEENIVRINFEGAFLFRACPSDHPVLEKSNTLYHDEPILVSFKMYSDPRMRGVPKTILNFVTRTAIGQMWSKLIEVAEDVRDGIRPHHQDKIDAQKEFYGWVESRIHVMFERLKQDTEET